MKFSDLSCTYIVLKLGDLLFQNVGSHFIVFYHTADLQLFDAVADRNQLRSSPQETVHLYGAHALLQLRHFGLVIPLIDEKPYIWNRNYTWHFKIVSVEVLVQVWRPAGWRIWRWGLVFWLSSGRIPAPSLLWYALPPHLPHHCQTGQYHHHHQHHYVPQPWASGQEQPSDKTICRLWTIAEFVHCTKMLQNHRVQVGRVIYLWSRRWTLFQYSRSGLQFGQRGSQIIHRW